jgi:hypothetical protein
VVFLALGEEEGVHGGVGEEDEGDDGPDCGDGA